MKIALLTVVIIFAVLFLLKLRIGYEYVKNGGEKGRFDMFILLFGKRIKLPEGKKGKDGKKKEKREKPDIPLYEKVRSASRTLAALSRAYGTTREYLRKRLVFKKTEVYLKFGTGDAATTGIVTGALWSLLYQGLGFLSCVGTVDAHDFDVVPVYNAKGFCIRVTGIISFRLINIITAGIKFYRAFKKVMKNKL